MSKPPGQQGQANGDGDVKFYDHDQLLLVDKEVYKKLWDEFTRPLNGTRKTKIGLSYYRDQRKQLVELQGQNKYRYIYLLLRQLANHEMNPHEYPLTAVTGQPKEGQVDDEIQETITTTEVLDVDASPAAVASIATSANNVTESSSSSKRARYDSEEVAEDSSPQPQLQKRQALGDSYYSRVPSDISVYQVTQKLGIEYHGGDYVLVGNRFSEEDLLKQLVKTGVPNIHNLDTEEEREKWIERVKFANVNRSNLRSAISNLNGYSNKILNYQEARDYLFDFGFQPTNNGQQLFYQPNGEKEGMHPMTLAELRVFIRENEKWDASNSRLKTGDEVSQRKEFSLRLWGATSPAPLPVYVAVNSTGDTDHPTAPRNAQRESPTRSARSSRNKGTPVPYYKEPGNVVSYWMKFHLSGAGWRHKPIGGREYNIVDSGGAFIPGVFYAAGITEREVLEHGTAGVHYAKGYSGLSEMVNEYGVVGGMHESGKFKVLMGFKKALLKELEELKKQILDRRQAPAPSMETESSEADDESVEVVPKTSRTLEDESSEQNNNTDSEPAARRVSFDAKDQVPTKTLKENLDTVWEYCRKMRGNPLLQQFSKDLVAEGEAPPQDFLDFLAFYNAMSAEEKKKLAPVMVAMSA